MKRKITAAITAIILLLTTIATDRMTYAAELEVQKQTKTFTKVEASEGIKNNTVNSDTLPESYSPSDKVTIIVELKEDSLLEHYNNKKMSAYINNEDSFNEYALTTEAENITDDIIQQQSVVANNIQSLKTEKKNENILYHYTAVLNGFAMKVNYGSLAAIRKIPNVKSAYIAGHYEKIKPVMDTSTKTIGAVDTWDLAYKGEGTIVAVIDTGLDTAHAGLMTEPHNPKYVQNDIQDKISSSSGLKSGVTNAADTYVNLKVPYAYDYADKDKEVTPTQNSVTANGNGHGTHVAGTIAAPDGDGDTVTGVAPESQLMIMKVFSDIPGNSDSSTEDILAALEDALILGADVINMSLGSANGFTEEGEESVTNVYNHIVAAGITMAVAAGNNYSIAYNNGLNNSVLNTNPDTAVISSPSTYSASTSVASVVNAKHHADYFAVEGHKITYTDTAAAAQPNFSSLSSVSGGALSYVVVPNVGSTADYSGLDVRGKISVVKRGSIDFNEKVLNAYNQGAIGIVIYNNQPGSIAMSITDYRIPAVSITMEDGETMAAAVNKILTVSASPGVFPDENANHASDFSSWGVTPDLELKPELSAPGENIYSTVPFGQYASMSGTSMAAPHIAGSFALLKQYLNTTPKFGVLNDTEKAELANDLLMSTAIPVKNSEGTYYSPRKQGSGLVNVYNAVNTDIYLFLSDENEPNQRPKLNLVDDVSKSGTFSKSFQIRSVTGSSVRFVPQVTTLTESESNGFITETPSNISSDTNVEIWKNGVKESGSITLEPFEEATITLKLTLNTPVKSTLNTAFPNGTFIDGYFIFNSLDSNIDLSIPFLGFYGDWTTAPLFDSGSANDLEGYQQTIHALFTESGNELSYLGVNPFDNNAYDLIGKYNPYLDSAYYDYYQPAAGLEKIAISPNGDGEFDRFKAAQLSLLRNVKNMSWAITDSNGNILSSDVLEYKGKSIYNPDMGAINPIYIQDASWEGTDALGNPLANNSTVYFQLTGELDYDKHSQNNQRASLSFPINIDLEKPVLEDVSVNGSVITISVRDNQYIAAVYLFSKDDMVNPVGKILLDEAIKGTTTPIDLDLNDLGLSGKTTDDLAVKIFDYAMNSGTYELVHPVTPTQAPTTALTQAPTTAPTQAPTTAPTTAPTQAPTTAPTQAPTSSPSVPISVPESAAAPIVIPTPTPTITPTPVPINYFDQVEVLPSATTFYPGQSGNMTVVIPFRMEDNAAEIAYSTSDKSVATISSDGKITAKKAGSVTIIMKVTINQKSKVFKTEITVKMPYISFTKKISTAKAGNTYTCAAKAHGVNNKITYHVSNTELASINQRTGILKAKKAGTVYVIAKAGKITKKYKVIIK